MWHVAACYHFFSFPGHAQWQQRIDARARELGIYGIILLADEGLNTTFSARERNVMETFLQWLETECVGAPLAVKWSTASERPFDRLKVRLKQEIVTLRAGQVDVPGQTGHRVSPEAWNALIQQEDVWLVDARNDYEIAFGTFKGAVNPKTTSFSKLPEFIHRERPDKRSKVAMFCTGGIRCEKMSALLREQGYETVYQLDGGILNYLAQVDEAESLWEGECFVFDQRVAVGHGLKVGHTQICAHCNTRLDATEQAHPDYEPGVCCQHCRPEMSAATLAARRERVRHKRMALAEADETSE